MVDNSHQPEHEENSQEDPSTKKSGFLSWEELQQQVEEKFARYGLTRAEVEAIDKALEDSKEPDVTPEKFRSYQEMTEDENESIRRTLDGIMESMRPQVELPKWQIDNIYDAYTGALSKTLGNMYTRPLPRWLKEPSLLGPMVFDNYLREADPLRHLFPALQPLWDRELGRLSRSVFDRFNFAPMADFVTRPEIEEELNELLEDDDEIREFADSNADEVAKTTGVSRTIARNLSVAAVFVIHWGLVLFIMTGVPFTELVPFIIATLSARGDAQDVIDRFNKKEDK